MDAARFCKPDVILLATDLTDLESLMPVALAIGARFGSHLVLLHVVPPGASVVLDAAEMSSPDFSAVLEFASGELQSWSERARQAGVSCHSLTLEGSVAVQILQSAAQLQADWILMGTKSQRNQGQMVLGSVTEQVLRSVHIPIMTVGPEAHLDAKQTDRKMVVLHPTSLRETSRPGAAFACQMAAAIAADLVLLHVMTPADGHAPTAGTTEITSDIERRMQALIEGTNGAPASNFTMRVVSGNPIIEVLAEAVANEAGLIVLEATESASFENLGRERLVFRVLAQAPCPVLTCFGQLQAAETAMPEGLALHELP